MKKRLVGTVLSDSMEKTIVVKVERFVEHRLYGKQMRRAKKYYAHDQEEIAKVGDRVEIEESSPYSKLKCWKLISVITDTDKN